MNIATSLSWLLLVTLSEAYVRAGVPDALMFYYVLYQSKLIPRWISGWGLIGTIVKWIVVMLILPKAEASSELRK